MAAENYESGRDSGLTPRVIELIPERKRAEIEAAIDAPLTVERRPAGWDSESGGEA